MTIVRDRIALAELKNLANQMFGDYVKAVADIGRGIMAVGGELHADEEALLLEDGSEQKDLWGINIHPDAAPEHRVEFDSVINLRPCHDNRTRGVDSPELRQRIIALVNQLVAP